MAQNPYDGGVPSVSPDATPPADYRHVETNPNMFGGAIATGLQQLGQGAVKATQFYSQVNAQDATNRTQGNIDGIIHGTGQTVTNPDGTTSVDAGYLGMRGIDAVSAREATLKKIDAEFAKGRSMVQTPEGQLDYDRWTQQYKSYALRVTGQHYDTQFHSYSQDTNKSQAGLELNAISNNAYDDNEFAKRLEGIKQAEVKQAQLNGTGPEGVNLAIQKATQDAWKARLEVISVDHPDQAYKMVQDHQKDLGPAYEPLAQQFRARAEAATGAGAANQELQKAKAAAGQGQGAPPSPQAQAFIQQRTNEPLSGVVNLNPVFADNLQRAVADAEAATGERAHFDSLARTVQEQAELRRKYEAGEGGLAAPPGQSRHNYGEAADLKDGKVLDWLHQNAGKYGLEFLSGHAGEIDRGHIQLNRADAGPHYAMRSATGDFGGAVGQIAPGATGRGTINAAWTQPLEQKGAGGAVSPAEHFQYLKGIGASDNEALMLTGAAASESSFDPNAPHDPKNGVYTGHGLYGHNDQRLDMRWQSWQSQAKMALNELRNTPAGQMVAEAKSPEDLAIAQMHYERPRAFTPDNPKAGENFSGRLNTLKYFSQMTQGVFTGSNGVPIKGGVASQPQPYAFGENKSVEMPQNGGLPPVDAPPAAPQYAPPAPQQPPAPPSPEQIKASAYQAILDRKDLNDNEKQHALSHISQTIAAEQIAEAATSKDRKERNDKASDGYIKQFISGNVSPDVVREIANDPNLEPSTRLHLGGIAEKYAGGGVAETNSYGKGFWDVFKAVTAPPDDPGRVTDVNQILKRAVPGGDLTLAGAEKLRSIMMQSDKSVDQAHLSGALNAVISGFQKKLSFDEEQLYPGMPPIKDPKGAFAFNTQFVPRVLGEYDKWISEGKNPWDFINDTKHFSEIAEQIRPSRQMAADRLSAGAAMAGEAPNATPQKQQPVPAAPQGVDPKEWQGVVTKPPVSESGKPWPLANWSMALNRLRADPSPENIKIFDTMFEAQGIKAEDILKRLPPNAR